MTITMATTGGDIPGKINEEFLVCKICFHQFSSEKVPKLLSCSHTFCGPCIEGYASVKTSPGGRTRKLFSCPMCRKLTLIPQEGPMALTNNYTVMGLLDMMAQVGGGGVPVECKDQVSVPMPMCVSCLCSTQLTSLPCNHYVCEGCVQGKLHTSRIQPAPVKFGVPVIPVTCPVCANMMPTSPTETPAKVNGSKAEVRLPSLQQEDYKGARPKSPQAWPKPISTRPPPYNPYFDKPPGTPGTDPPDPASPNVAVPSAPLTPPQPDAIAGPSGIQSTPPGPKPPVPPRGPPSMSPKKGSQSSKKSPTKSSPTQSTPSKSVIHFMGKMSSPCSHTPMHAAFPPKPPPRRLSSPLNFCSTSPVKCLRKFGKFSQYKMQTSAFQNPTRVDVSEKGDLAVVDPQCMTVQIFSASGDYLSMFKAVGVRCAVFMTSEKIITGSHRGVEMYSTSGDRVGELAIGPVLSLASYKFGFVVCKSKSISTYRQSMTLKAEITKVKVERQGCFKKAKMIEFHDLKDVATTDLKDIVVLDGKGAFIIFSEEGIVKQVVEFAKEVCGPLKDPFSITVDKTSTVLVSDSGNGQILKFSPSGAFSKAYLEFGAEKANSDPIYPSGIAVTSKNEIIVVVTGNKFAEVRIYAP